MAEIDFLQILAKVAELVYGKTSEEISAVDERLTNFLDNQYSNEIGIVSALRDKCVTMEDKLDGIEEGANKTIVDTILNENSNSAVANAAVTAALIQISALASNAVPRNAIGAAGGVAPLDDNNKVPAANLPSYVDDVLEFESKSKFPTNGESGKIYDDKSTNKTYRWSGTTYVEISSSLTLGETSSTAFPGDKGKSAYEHTNDVSSNPHETKFSQLKNIPTNLMGSFEFDETHCKIYLKDYKGNYILDVSGNKQYIPVPLVSPTKPDYPGMISLTSLANMLVDETAVINAINTGLGVE